MSNLAEPRGRLKPCFAKVQPFSQTGKYITALMSELPRKNARQRSHTPGAVKI